MDFYLTAYDLPVDSSPLTPEAGKSRETALWWYDEMREPLRRYLKHAGAAPGEIDDTIQETFLRLYRQVRDGEPITNVRAWLYRVSGNALRDERRGARRRPTVSLDDPDQGVSRSLRDAGDPEIATIGQERDELLRAAIEGLSAREREFVALRSSGLKYREIAEVMETSVAAVSGLALRVTARLAEALA